MKYTLEFYKEGKTIKSLRTGKIKKLHYVIHSDEYADFDKAYLCVSYGKALDCWGKIESFINEGEYYSKTHLLYALACFTEKNDN